MLAHRLISPLMWSLLFLALAIAVGRCAVPRLAHAARTSSTNAYGARR